MNIKEIIKNLLDQAEDRESSIDPDDPEDIFRLDARVLREAARLLGGMEPPNDPLTLEQLREMVGEPIYIVDFEHPEASGWEICEETHTDAWSNCDNVAAYGKTWLAYRRRPEEAKKEDDQ